MNQIILETENQEQENQIIEFAKSLGVSYFVGHNGKNEKISKRKKELLNYFEDPESEKNIELIGDIVDTSDLNQWDFDGEDIN